MDHIAPEYQWLGCGFPNTYSQCGEDGILAAIFDRLGVTRGTCLEVGAADGVWLSNTKLFADKGWHRILIEGDPVHFDKLDALAGRQTTVHKLRIEHAGPNSIDRLTMRPLDLVVIDIDGQDYWAFKHLSHMHTVVCVERAHGPDDAPPPWLGCGACIQAGTLPLIELGKEKGYTAVAVCGVNVIFVQSDKAELLKC